MERDLTYRFPDYPVPEGFTPTTYLDWLCREAAVRKFGHVSARVDERLKEEMRRIGKHNLAGLLLIYHEVVSIAREVQVDLGLVDPEVPIEEAPPGRGRGSSVALMTGYLLGISHIDPIECGLTLDRFLPEELASVPDIDLDFPRDIREELIKRVHERWGWQHAALTGAISTYKIRGAIRDLGLALGLPEEQIDKLAKGTEHATAGQLRQEMLALPDFRDKVDAPVWRDLIELAAQLGGFPRGLAQHPGGMIISPTPLIDQVPVHQAAMEGRYLCHWDRDAIEDAGFVKIDILAIGALSQMQEAVRLIEARTGESIDLSRIGFEDPVVYDMLHRADTIGIFQVESAAQIQTITRIKPLNLTDMACKVAAVRPGVGVNDGVSEYIRRRTAGTEAYDHPLEEPALKRTLGIILFQDQFNELAVRVAGFSAKEADELRRAFQRADEMEYIASHWWPKFREGARENGVDEPTAAKIFKKFNGQYMFPEAHAYAFGATAYQMAWLKCYYPLEFFVGLFNEQPMGFYNLETLKEDAKRHGVQVLHPDVNRSAEGCVIAGLPLPARPELVEGANQGLHTSDDRSSWRDTDALLLGLLHVREVGSSVAEAIVREREANGPYASVADLMERTGIRREALDNLADAGALDQLGAGRAGGYRSTPPVILRQPQVAEESRSHPPPAPDSHPTQIPRSARNDSGTRRDARWEIGLRYRPVDRQISLRLPVEQDMVPLPQASQWELMSDEYRTMGLHPASHLMAYLRDSLPGVHTSEEVADLPDGTEVRVAGLVIRRQRPLAKAIFITLEDEFGHTPVVVWPAQYARLRHLLREPVLLIAGTVSRRGGTMNVVVHGVEPLQALGSISPPSKN